ncbi:MAG: O-antigen ligase family protein [Hydrogenophilales bacterium]|nr:O-antigen ligase family protein [Hydrogenophilales bacterium]
MPHRWPDKIMQINSVTDMRFLPTATRYPIEFAFLALLIVFLPAFEAPKNIFWATYVITWIVNRVRDKDFGGKWKTWDTLIILWIASGYIVAAFAGLKHEEWLGAHDILRYGSIFWLVMRGRYDDAQLRWLLGAIILSTLLTLGMGFWQFYVSHTKNSLQLHSVGHVNHSAIYLAMVFGAALCWLLAAWRTASLALRVLLIAALGLITLALFIAESRAAAGMALLLVLGVGFIWLPKSKTPLLVMTVAAITLIGGSLFFNARLIEKTRGAIKSNVTYAERPEIWNVAVEAWRQYPIFGVGMDNFGEIGKHLQSWVATHERPNYPKRYVAQAHGHSLYFNTLAERGAFGLSILLAVLAYWAYCLVRRWPSKTDDDMCWLLWGGAFSAWFITVGVGTFNTTLHHEHAILAVLLLGFWLSHESRHILKA